MHQEDTKDHLKSLPFEMKEKVFSYLPASNLCSLSCVDRTMNEAVKNSVKWKDLCLGAKLKDKPAEMSWMKYFWDYAPLKTIRLSVLWPDEEHRFLKGKLQIRVNDYEIFKKPKYQAEPTRETLIEKYPLRKSDFLEGVCVRYMLAHDSIAYVMSPEEAFDHSARSGIPMNDFNNLYSSWSAYSRNEWFDEAHTQASFSKENLRENWKKLESLRLNLSQGLQKGYLQPGLRQG